MMLEPWFKPLLAVLLVTSLAGCSSDNSDLIEWMAEVKNNEKPKVEPLPLLEPCVPQT